jgi:hypothetical protein
MRTSATVNVRVTEKTNFILDYDAILRSNAVPGKLAARMSMTTKDKPNVTFFLLSLQRPDPRHNGSRTASKFVKRDL